MALTPPSITALAQGEFKDCDRGNVEENVLARLRLNAERRGSAVTTIVEVARKAGVSVSTVSHVVNRTRFVSPETASLVNQAIAVVGYPPNNLARSLKRASTNSVGLAISAISNPISATSSAPSRRNAHASA